MEHPSIDLNLPATGVIQSDFLVSLIRYVVTLYRDCKLSPIRITSKRPERSDRNGFQMWEVRT